MTTRDDLFLSISEIERLTGKKRPSAQIRWLINYGYKFAVNGLKQPIVMKLRGSS